MCHLDYEPVADTGYDDPQHMKALVFSGGAGFGAYQVGAWRALAEAGWHPDVVLGTSIGAVNAFLVSRGLTFDELRQAWVEMPAQFAFPNGRFHLYPYAREVPRFRAWTAEVARQFGVRPLLTRLHICMVELFSGAMRVVEDQAVTERHLLAACALPAVMRPVRVDGRICVDGGTLYHIPLKEAVATGATEIIAVDVLHATPCNPVRVLRLATLRVRNLLRGETHEPPPQALARLKIRNIGHHRPLGTMRECFEWNPAKVERMIDAGYQDTFQSLQTDRSS